MPIQQEKFIKGIDESSIILTFLKKNHDMAFTVSEITAATLWIRSKSFWPNFNGAHVVINTLDNLISRGLVEKKVIMGKYYYKIR